MFPDKSPHELWDLTCTPAHTSSRLYCLQPVGLGTADVECLTSYVNRLAEAHSVSPYALLVRECGPQVHPDYFANGKPRYALFNNDRWQQIAMTLNSLNAGTQRWVQGLEKLTTHPCLHQLTLLQWKPVLSNHKLLRHHNAWCPQCYEARSQSGETIYTPLAWMINSVTVCTKHRCYLQERCDCGRTHPAVSARSQAGYCPHCERWLGKAEHNAGHLIIDNEWETQHWIADVVGQMLAAQSDSARGTHIQPWRSLRTHILMEYAQGNVAVLSRKMDVPYTVADRWLKKCTRLPLKGVLRLAWATAQTPLDMLTGKVTTYTNPPKTLCSGQTGNNVRHKRRPLDKQQLHVALEAQLHVEVPLSLKQVAQQLDRCPEVLRKGFPDLCHAIVVRYRNYRSEQGEIRLQKVCDEVSQIVFDLHSQGLTPTASLIRQKLGRSVLLERTVYEFYVQCRRNLNCWWR